MMTTGARQTGKTTLLKSAYPDLSYFNLDAMEFREQLSRISSFSWARDVGSAVIDEIQKVFINHITLQWYQYLTIELIEKLTIKII